MRKLVVQTRQRRSCDSHPGSFKVLLSSFTTPTSNFEPLAPMSALLRRFHSKQPLSPISSGRWLSSISKMKTVNESALISSIETLIKEEDTAIDANGWPQILDTPNSIAKWEPIMDQVRNIDPHASSIQLSLNCVNFIGGYFRQIPKTMHDINQMQDEGHHDPDIKLAYLLYHNIIERSHDENVIIQTLMDSLQFSVLIRDKRNFQRTVDRLLTDHWSELTKGTVLLLFRWSAFIGSWTLMPRLQRIMIDNETDWKDWKNVGMDVNWSELSNLCIILNNYNFKLPEFNPKLLDYHRITGFKSRLKMDKLKCQSEEIRDEYLAMNGFIVDNELITDWKEKKFDFDLKEGAFRRGAICDVQYKEGKVIKCFNGPCSNQGIHCRCSNILGYDKATGDNYISQTETLCLEKNAIGNYWGFNHVYIERRGSDMHCNCVLLDYLSDFVMEVE